MTIRQLPGRSGRFGGAFLSIGLDFEAYFDGYPEEGSGLSASGAFWRLGGTLEYVCGES